jgi:hypothetical protein
VDTNDRGRGGIRQEQDGGHKTGGSDVPTDWEHNRRGTTDQARRTDQGSQLAARRREGFTKGGTRDNDVEGDDERPDRPSGES